MSTNNIAYTANGAVSLASTQDARLNLFFKAVRDLGVLPIAKAKSAKEAIAKKKEGDSSDCEEDSSGEGGESNQQLYQLIDNAWDVDPLDTMKILFNWRDCRGGKGDYRGFIASMAYIEGKHSTWFYENMKVIPEYGSWLDLVKLWHFANGKDKIMAFIVEKLNSDLGHLSSGDVKKMGDISLLAKWLPSENSLWDRYTGDKKARFIIHLCKQLFGVKKVESKHIKSLRKTIVSPLREHLKIVESKMCAKEFDEINYEAVPSVAMNIYKKAFKRNDEDRFTKYLEQVKSGEKKINAGQVYPHDLVREYLTKGGYTDPVVEEQWKVVKAKAQETGAFKGSICVCDVSGSMSGTPMEVAVALGLLGLYENKVITFSEIPQLHHIPDGSLYEQVRNISKMSWGMSTNFERVMDLILGLSCRQKGDEIKRVFVFSDMQFNMAFQNASGTHFQILSEKFKQAGQEMPQIIFWNLRGETKDFPVSCDEKGVIMLSGYSPSLLASIIDGGDISPLDMCLKVIRAPRYDLVKPPADYLPDINTLTLSS